MNRIMTAAAATALALGTGLATLVLGTPAGSGRQVAAPVSARLAAADANDVVSYDSQGVTVAPPVATASVPAPSLLIFPPPLTPPGPLSAPLKVNVSAALATETVPPAVATLIGAVIAWLPL